MQCTLRPVESYLDFIQDVSDSAADMTHVTGVLVKKCEQFYTSSNTRLLFF